MTVYRIDPSSGALLEVFTIADGEPVPAGCITVPPPDVQNPRWNPEAEVWETGFIPGGGTP